MAAATDRLLLNGPLSGSAQNTRYLCDPIEGHNTQFRTPFVVRQDVRLQLFLGLSVSRSFLASLQTVPDYCGPCIHSAPAGWWPVRSERAVVRGDGG